MRNISNPVQACSDIFLHPSAVFQAVHEKHNWSWLPFLLVTFFAVLPGYLYLDFVDFDWYRDFIINTNYGDISPSEQQMYRDNMTRSQFKMIGLISTVLALVIMNAVFAIYLNVVTKADDNSVDGFTDWYGFTWWYSMPAIFVSITALFLIAVSTDHQIGPSVLGPTSLGYLFNVSTESDWYTFSQFTRLDTIWMVFLTYLGIRSWTSLTSARCAVIALAPHLVIYGIWALIIVM